MHKVSLLPLLLAASAIANVGAIRDSIAESIIAKRYEEVPERLGSLRAAAEKIRIHPLTTFENLALRYMVHDTAFLLNVDSLEWVKSEAYHARVSVSRDALFLNAEDAIKDYLGSGLFAERLARLDPDEALFLRLVSQPLIAESAEQTNEYVREHIHNLRDTTKYGYVAENVWFAFERKPWSFGFDIGGGGNVFVNGAEDALRNTGHMDFGFQVCRRPYCAEWEFQVINAESRRDIVQGSRIYPAKSGPQILRTNYNLGYMLLKSHSLHLTSYAGLSLNPFGIAEKQRKDYDVKDDLEGFSVGYNVGGVADIYFGKGRQTGPNELSFFALRLRAFYTSLSEPDINGLEGGDFNWSIQALVDVSGVKRGRYRPKG